MASGAKASVAQSHSPAEQGPHLPLSPAPSSGGTPLGPPTEILTPELGVGLPLVEPLPGGLVGGGGGL